jgi:hypothetical protein
MTAGTKYFITAVGSLALIAVILSLYIWGSSWHRKALAWEQQAGFEAAKIDTVWMPGEYGPPETTYVDNPYPVPGKPDTVWQHTPLVGYPINFDTTKTFGPKSNPLSVRVRGQFWWPAQFSARNWMLILPSYAQNNAIEANSGKTKDRGIAIGSGYSTRSGVPLGLSYMGKNGSLDLKYFPHDKSWLLTRSFAIWRL